MAKAAPISMRNTHLRAQLERHRTLEPGQRAGADGEGQIGVFLLPEVQAAIETPGLATADACLAKGIITV